MRWAYLVCAAIFLIVVISSSSRDRHLAGFAEHIATREPIRVHITIRSGESKIIITVQKPPNVKSIKVSHLEVDGTILKVLPEHSRDQQTDEITVFSARGVQMKAGQRYRWKIYQESTWTDGFSAGGWEYGWVVTTRD